MSVVSRFFTLSFCAIIVAGCGSVNHEADNAMSQYVSALERRNKELEGELTGLKRFARDASLVAKENEFYDEIAQEIQDWLGGSRLGGPGVTFDSRTGKWTLASDVLFNSGQYVLSSKGSRILQAFAKAYEKNGTRFRIVGHTDRDPITKKTTRKALPVSGRLNLELSVLRAVAVAGELEKNGIPETRMLVEGHGNLNPIAPNDRTVANKAKNRRVEIFLLKTAPAK